MGEKEPRRKSRGPPGGSGTSPPLPKMSALRGRGTKEESRRLSWPPGPPQGSRNPAPSEQGGLVERGPARPAPALAPAHLRDRGGAQRPALGAWVPGTDWGGGQPRGRLGGEEAGLAVPGRSDGYEEAEWAWLHEWAGLWSKWEGLGQGARFTKGRGLRETGRRALG